MMKNNTIKQSLYVPNVPANQKKNNVRGLSGLKAIWKRGFVFGTMITFSVFLIGVIVAHASMCIVPPEEGNWRNYDSQTRGITRIKFRMECRDASQTSCSGGICRTTFAVESHYFIHLYGSCYPTDCDWGEVEGEKLTGSLDGWYLFHYNQGFAKRYVYVRTYTAWPGWLRLWIFTDFTDPGRDDYVMDDWFRKY